MERDAETCLSVITSSSTSDYTYSIHSINHSVSFSRWSWIQLNSINLLDSVNRNSLVVHLVNWTANMANSMVVFSTSKLHFIGLLCGKVHPVAFEIFKIFRGYSLWGRATSSSSRIYPQPCHRPCAKSPPIRPSASVSIVPIFWNDHCAKHEASPTTRLKML